MHRALASRWRARLAVAGLLLVAASCGGTCGSTSTAQQIEGYWSWEGDGVQQVRSTGSGNFDGIVVKVASIGQCAAPLGRIVLKLQGSGTHYTGQDEWFRESDCARRFSSNAVVEITNGGRTAHLCSTGPFTDVAPVSNCVDLQKAVNFTP